MTNSQNENQSNPKSSKSVPFEVVDTSAVQSSDAKPAKVTMEVAGLEPEPEPHEFLSAALGLKPKKKVGAKKAAAKVAAPIEQAPVVEQVPVAVGGDPFASAPATQEDEAEEELVSVADLGDDEDDFDPAAEEPQAVQQPEVAEVSKPVAAIEVDAETDLEDESDFAAADAAVENPFVAMQLSPEVLEAIGKAGYDNPSPIQLQTVPHLMDGRDLIGQAETGSGKTAAFALSLIHI